MREDYGGYARRKKPGIGPYPMGPTMITSETKLSISWPVKTSGVLFMDRTILIALIKSDSLSTAKGSAVRSVKERYHISSQKLGLCIR